METLNAFWSSVNPLRSLWSSFVPYWHSKLALLPKTAVLLFEANEKDSAKCATWDLEGGPEVPHVWQTGSYDEAAS